MHVPLPHQKDQLLLGKLQVDVGHGDHMESQVPGGVLKYLQWYYISFVEPCEHFRVNPKLTHSQEAFQHITCTVIYIK